MGTSRKRVSKKNKKSWRKNVDISDVDNFLEDQRLEERLGVKYAQEKDENLFQIDTKGQNEIGKSFDVITKYDSWNNIKSPKVISHGSELRLKEENLPKCFEILEKRSAVPVAICPSKSIKTSDLNKKRIQRKLAAKRKKILKSVARNISSEKDTPNKNKFTYDIWSKKDSKTLDSCSEWLTNDTIRHTLQNTGERRKQIPKSILSKTSLLPAVEFPHPGMSYNPSLKDHTDVLIKAAEKELEVIKEEKHLDRVTKQMFSKTTKEQMEKEWLSEMTVGLTQTKDDSEDDDDNEYKAVNPPVKNKKKTLQKRRKKKEALELKEKLKRQKIEKKKLSDISKLKMFNESLNKREEKILRRMERRKEKKKQKPFMTKFLSQTKYKEPEIDFHLGEELSGNLRNVKPEGNLLYDRFKSLQKRNILQPTVKRHVKKAITKEYERNHTKMEWEK